MPTLFAKTLRSQIKQAKSQKDLQLFKRLNVLLAVAMEKPIDKVADYHNISVKSVNRWINKYQIEGMDGLKDADKSGRKPKLTKDEMLQFKDLIIEDKERVWVAKHILNTIMMLFSVVYSVSYCDAGHGLKLGGESPLWAEL
jgi:transposase